MALRWYTLQRPLTTILLVLLPHLPRLSMAGVTPLRMRPLGAYCGGPAAGGNASGCDETTPVMWHGQLVMVERHQHFRVRRQHQCSGCSRGEGCAGPQLPG